MLKHIGVVFWLSIIYYILRSGAPFLSNDSNGTGLSSTSFWSYLSALLFIKRCLRLNS
jgi:hypothetical protein